MYAMAAEGKVIQVINPPVVEYGRTVILEFIEMVDKALKHSPGVNSKYIEAAFLEIFGTVHAAHLCRKYKLESFGSFYLNLDIANELALLKYLFATKKQHSTALPEIPNWQNIGKPYFGGGDFTQNDVRMVAPAYKEISHWDAFPHAQIWCHRFVLYATNNSIFDKFYKGKNYGTYYNWVGYFLKLGEQDQLKFVEKLIAYND